jgi:hypothetical protein
MAVLVAAVDTTQVALVVQETHRQRRHHKEITVEAEVIHQENRLAAAAALVPLVETLLPVALPEKVEMVLHHQLVDHQ